MLRTSSSDTHTVAKLTRNDGGNERRSVDATGMGQGLGEETMPRRRAVGCPGEDARWEHKVSGELRRCTLTYPGRVYYPSYVTIDKWIVLIVAVGAIIALNVSFIRRMNRRDRDDKRNKE